MKMNKGVIVACLLSLVALSCESDFQELNSLNDLKRVYSANSLPMHSLTLLHWFANNVDIDNNDVVRLSFDTNRDFGSHTYRNYEGLLPSVSQGYQYCTIGNVNRPPGNTCPFYEDFPNYVLYPRVIENYGTGRNRDRIIVSVQTQTYSARRVSQVYLTQHYNDWNHGSGYDPDNTFIITTNLLQQLRLFSFTDNTQSLQELRDQFDNNIDDNMLNDLINIEGRAQARLGLLYLIVVPRSNNLVGVCRSYRRLARAVKTTGDMQNCEIQHIYLQVMTGGNGKAQIIWRNVPRDKLDGGVAVALFKNQMDQGKSLTFKKIQDSEGSYDTSVTLNDGLQVRLHKVEGWYPTLKEEICRGNEFQSPQAVSITGYAQLQLFVRDGTACSRLYVKKGCDQWTTDFKWSWVALYTSAGKDTNDYITSQWQWATKFEQGLDSGEYDTFEYCTGTTVTPGLQARFIIENYEEKARSPVWR